MTSRSDSSDATGACIHRSSCGALPTVTARDLGEEERADPAATRRSRRAPAHRHNWRHAIRPCVGAVAILLAADATAQTVTLDLSGGGSLTRSLFQLFILTTVLALMPTAAVTVTCFTRLIIVFSLIRSAIGLQQAPPNIVLTSLAIFLSLFIMAPTFDDCYKQAVAPYLSEQINETEALQRGIEPFRRFMLRNVRATELDLMESVARKRTGQGAAAASGEPDLRVLIPAFMLSELRVAFEMGFLIFLPFLIIDIVVSAILMAMGMMMVPPVLIALPFKLIFFVYTDGWVMLVGALLESYQV
ncbi:MAG: flagellar type III secretion system pore protein FliP [Alphaproteobacteria bacterium]|nr:flagellar type III secretion system pore protein FliP [Alphaproteobacteria bacterium]